MSKDSKRNYHEDENAMVQNMNDLEALGKEMYFINSEDRASESLAAFRAKYNMPTVPGLLVARGGEVRVVCDSSQSLEQIKAFIG